MRVPTGVMAILGAVATRPKKKRGHLGNVERPRNHPISQHWVRGSRPRPSPDHIPQAEQMPMTPRRIRKADPMDMEKAKRAMTDAAEAMLAGDPRRMETAERALELLRAAERLPALVTTDPRSAR